MPSLSDRPLLRAFAISLLAHGALFAGAPPVPMTTISGSQSLTVSVVSKPAAAEKGARPDTAVAPVPRPSTQPKPPSAKTRVLAATDQKRQDDNDSPHIAAPAFNNSVTHSSTAPADAPTTGAHDGAAQTGKPATTPVQPSRQEGVHGNDIRQYRTSLAISAKRFKRYPPAARAREWEGSVEITLGFRGATTSPELAVSSSSSHTILDEQALETLRQAARITELPERLRGKDFRLTLTVDFSLDEDR
jgi:protein TonB